MRSASKQDLFLFAPYFVLITAFLIVPAIGLFEISFRDHSPISITGGGVSMSSYIRLLDPFYLKIILQTLKLSFIATLIGTVLAYPVAYILARSEPRGRTLITCLVMVPLMTSVVVKVFGWYILMGRNGLIANMFSAIGIGSGNLLGNEIAVLVGLAEFSLPFMIFSLASSIERIPRSVEEAASNLGATPLMVFFKVILPMSRTGLLSGFLLCFGVSSSAYVVPAILGGTSVRMVAQQIYDDVLVGFNWPGAAALSVLLLVLLGSVLYVAIALGRRQA
jgi:putative spermidine/putrescine transport system permease protein